jgi:hypothetical protein
VRLPLRARRFGAAAARAAGFRPLHETHPPGVSKAEKFGFGVLGYFVGAIPIGLINEYLSFLGQGDSELLCGLSVITGIAGMLIASLRKLAASGTRRLRYRKRCPAGAKLHPYRS